ncbi:MAG: hypothetical protein ACYTGZ_21480 [Planctomycetota bacterium]|jgi:hypothetical protein
MRSWTNGQLLKAVVVLAAVATLFGIIDVVVTASGRNETKQLEKRVHELEREVKALRTQALEHP